MLQCAQATPLCRRRALLPDVGTWGRMWGVRVAELTDWLGREEAWSLMACILLCASGHAPPGCIAQLPKIGGRVGSSVVVLRLKTHVTLKAC